MKIEQLLSENTHTPVYRGMRVDGEKQIGDIVTFAVRQDRKPSNSSALSTAMFDYAIEQKFGIRNCRRSSVFATTEMSYARDYAGNHTPGALVELMLPPEARLVYNPTVDDSMFVMDLGPAWKKMTALLEAEAVKYRKRHNDERTSDEFVMYFTRRSVDVYQYLNTESPETLIDRVAKDMYHHDPDGEEAKRVADRIKTIAMSMIDGYVVANASQFNVSGDVEVIISGISQGQGKVVEFFS